MKTITRKFNSAAFQVGNGTERNGVQATKAQ